MTVDLVMQISRDDRDRLSGTVRSAGGTEVHVFFGTLELMRALEELVPADDALVNPSIERKRS